MEEIGKKTVIYLSHYIDTRLFKAVGSKVVKNIFIEHDEAYLNMRKIDMVNFVYGSLKKIDHLKVWKRENIPEEFHLKKNLRNGDILIICEIGYSIDDGREKKSRYWKYRNGQHGYVGDEFSMYPLFISHGPAFKSNFKIKNFRIVDLYPLMCHVLGILKIILKMKLFNLNLYYY